MFQCPLNFENHHSSASFMPSILFLERASWGEASRAASDGKLGDTCTLSIHGTVRNPLIRHLLGKLRWLWREISFQTTHAAQAFILVSFPHHNFFLFYRKCICSVFLTIEVGFNYETKAGLDILCL